MKCPNRCDGDNPLTTIKVQRAIVNQINNIQVKCHMCKMTYQLGERETHYKLYCPNIQIEHCIFPDCKTFVSMNRADFENHLVNECGSKFKQCKICDLDVYKFYHEDVYREQSKGHLCERDCMMFLAESILDRNREEEREEDEKLPDFGGDISVDVNNVSMS